jgi:hypothetical protein
LLMGNQSAGALASRPFDALPAKHVVSRGTTFPKNEVLVSLLRNSLFHVKQKG